MSISRLSALAAITGAVTLAACSDASGPTAKAVSLSFMSSAPVAAASASQPGFYPDVIVAAGADTLVITRVQLVLSEIELEDSTTCTPSTEPGDDDSCFELEYGPVLVDLPVTPGVVQALDALVPAGQYTELEFEVERPEQADGAAEAAFLAQHPGFAGVSVRVEGTYNGEPFVFTSDAEAEMEFEFAPPIVIGASGANITVSIDVASWFRTASGALIDPRTANAGGSNESLVENNIRASIDVYDDDDRDGRPDDSP